jgi:dolichol kinase
MIYPSYDFAAIAGKFKKKHAKNEIGKNKSVHGFVLILFR